MQPTDELPDAYLRLLAAQRQPTDAELDEIEKAAQRESLQNRFRRRYPKVY